MDGAVACCVSVFVSSRRVCIVYGICMFGVMDRVASVTVTRIYAPLTCLSVSPPACFQQATYQAGRNSVSAHSHVGSTSVEVFIHGQHRNPFGKDETYTNTQRRATQCLFIHSRTGSGRCTHAAFLHACTRMTRKRKAAVSAHTGCPSKGTGTLET